MAFVIQIEQPGQPKQWVRWAFSSIGIIDVGFVRTTKHQEKAKVYKDREAANKAVAAITSTSDGMRLRIVETT